MSEQVTASEDTIGLRRKLKKEETVVGGRRLIKSETTLDVVGPRRDSSKTKRGGPDDRMEIRIAAPHQPAKVPGEKVRKRAEKNSSSAFLLLVAATLILVGATLATFFLLDRYQPTSEVLLAKKPFSENFAGWIRQGSVSFEPGDPGEPDRVTLNNDDPDGRTIVRRVIDLPPGFSLIYLSATVSTERVDAGEDLWQRARIYFAQLDQDGRANWSKPHNLFRLRGTKSTRTVKQIFPIPSDVKQAALALELNNATGSMTVHDLHLYPVEEQPGFRRISQALMAAWGLLLIAVAIAVFKSIQSNVVRLGLGGMFGVLLLGLFMPASLRDTLVSSLPLPAGGEGGIEPDMIGHGVVFAIMAFLFRIRRPMDPILLHVGCWALIALASETLQLFTFDREPSMVDFFVDGIGFLVGLTFAAVLPRWLPNRL